MTPYDSHMVEYNGRMITKNVGRAFADRLLEKHMIRPQFREGCIYQTHICPKGEVYYKLIRKESK